MPNKTEILVKPYLKNDLPDLRPGDTVRVRQKIKDIASPNKKEKAKEEKKRNKEKTQTFEGLIIARKHGKGINATITVRRVISGVGVERVFPIHSPMISKIEIVRRGKIRRAKLYYLRTAKGKKSKLKRQDFSQAIAEPAKETPSIPESAEPK
ncbi:MAG: 50S ribosomal protein L19 [Candidatus Nealsonbacteria bacterium RIFCSPLOWO2_12_FULL_39_31]|uniref:Large ribosomal subunit protein bL19 n=1 Tax=Candidatus Nealsonbacteria bacterium RIFCSPLOWO2_12_FULL_39_31 TaxID=1801676 RepID=A0A1G2ELS3_9BACT|nr:MAG: 50S ribosomal protein L19 [Candidatus Nealsonbacteria bacterium RIFCSPHIGHO2_02_FULL_38_75]OGZ25666.1 MAG: 50S ribosomal protein L19 [Candidatus Nealsonbacteria bacterium RIFCSPLOWO2_02_FULL_38_63]OGZ26764.1 MAG: 50S ribosomal protein L19 [Candidatus Nealsonbacteria bacterium RIFCSPLOWO2_12_FULL_39_31]